MTNVLANFTRDTFAALLYAEAIRCLRVAVERGWLTSSPDSIAYYFPTATEYGRLSEDKSEVFVPGGTLLSQTELLPHLFREEDGHFRSEIGLSPYAATGSSTVIEVCLRSTSWTNVIPTGKHAFPNEPFVLSGPRLPSGWREGQPMPLMSLPMMRIV